MKLKELYEAKGGWFDWMKQVSARTGIDLPADILKKGWAEDEDVLNWLFYDSMIISMRDLPINEKDARFEIHLTGDILRISDKKNYVSILLSDFVKKGTDWFISVHGTIYTAKDFK